MDSCLVGEGGTESEGPSKVGGVLRGCSEWSFGIPYMRCTELSCPLGAR